MDHGIAAKDAGNARRLGSLCLDFAAMDRRLARRNLRTGLITAVIALLMFALTFVAAVLYVQ
jgi:predicted secreted protein